MLHTRAVAQRTVYMSKFVVVFWVVVALVGLLALVHLPPAIDRFDMQLHFLAFYVLGCAALVGFPRTSLTTIACLLGLGGIAIETAQLLPVFGHAAEFSDLATDFTAIAAALVPAGLSRLRRRQRQSTH
jgi:hypothetical protein